MQAVDHKLILKKSDYELLVKFVFTHLNPMSADNKSAEQLYEELKSAEIHQSDEQIPAEVVRLNSIVEVYEETTGRQSRFQLVLPDEANLRRQKLSVFAPMGIALMGYKKGQKVNWEMPSGERVFHIRDVVIS